MVMYMQFITVMRWKVIRIISTVGTKSCLLNSYQKAQTKASRKTNYNIETQQAPNKACTPSHCVCGADCWTLGHFTCGIFEHFAKRGFGFFQFPSRVHACPSASTHRPLPLCKPLGVSLKIAAAIYLIKILVS
jgi:hypothetical protein